MQQTRLTQFPNLPASFLRSCRSIQRIYISAHQRLGRLLNRQYPSLTIEC
ncbi:hypothetical protein MGSAQ_000540 [marine sediment metagenome]|uniref:Uncharacterized protein n=1 Tax=marine sediment metagenome TaxID=412755 RepID=A0A1B6NWY4_9ZZZZ